MKAMTKEERKAYKEAIEDMSLFTVIDTDDEKFILQFKKKDGTILSETVEAKTYSDLLRDLENLQCIRSDIWLKEWVDEMGDDQLQTTADLKQMIEEANRLWISYQGAFYGVFWKKAEIGMDDEQ